MKKFVLALMVLVSVVTFTFAAPVLFRTTGFGKNVTVTTSPFHLSGFAANKVSVLNNDNSKTLFVLVNCSNTIFTTQQTAGQTIPIPAGSSYTFDMATKGAVTRVVMQAASGSIDVFIAAF